MTAPKPSNHKSYIEKIILENNNRVLDAKNGITDPTLGELLDPTVQALVEYVNEQIVEARVDELDRLFQNAGYGEYRHATDYHDAIMARLEALRNQEGAK